MSNLDDQEKLHLALSAMENNNHESAIELLKNISHKNYVANAKYLLAAEYAQIKLYEKAKEYFAEAYGYDNALTISMLQKGMLHMTLGEVVEAKKSYTVILDLGKEDYINYFAYGFNALLNDDLNTAKDNLLKGIDTNTNNEALNIDVKKVLDKISTSQDDSERGEVAEKGLSNRFFLNNYESDS